jgi:biopolymer transport protein ExbD
MAMNVGSGGGDDEVVVDINTTPLIDVMLVLLIMLIITIPVQTHAVKLDFPPPQPTPQDLKPPEVVDIVVDFNGDIYWNNELIPDRPTLEAKLAAIGAEPKEDQPEIHLRPNKLVEYKYVAEVMAEAQHNGAVKIGLLGNEQFADQ